MPARCYSACWLMRPEDNIPAEPGSYLLFFYLRAGRSIEVGRLGSLHFRRGWYLYCGSAFGPGGLRGRLRHHLNSDSRLHWHIDYLKQVAELRKIWFMSGANMEHHWSHELATLDGLVAPFRGFGSSDCECFSHLVYCRSQPLWGGLFERLDGAGRIKRRVVG